MAWEMSRSILRRLIERTPIKQARIHGVLYSLKSYNQA